MKDVAFERAVRAEPTRLLKRVEKWLTAHGYEVSARSNLELNLVGAGTSGRHRLTVRADGQSVRFVFAAGSPGVTLPDAAELERRVSAALDEFAAGPAAAAPVSGASGGRCSICAAALAPGDKVCPVCGMTT